MKNNIKRIISTIFCCLLQIITLIIKCTIQLIFKALETIWSIILPNALVFLMVTIAFLYLIGFMDTDNIIWDIQTVLVYIMLYVIVLWCSIAMSQSNEQNKKEQIIKEDINIKQTNISLFSWFKNINKK